MKQQNAPIKFILLQKVSMTQAVKSVLGQTQQNTFYQKHKKQLSQTLYVIQILHNQEQWILVKTNRQCQDLLKQIYESHEHFHKFVKKIQGLFVNITNILPFTHKNQFSDVNLIQQLNYLGQKNDILTNESFTNFIQFHNVHQRYTYRKFLMIKKNGGRYKQGCCRMGSMWTQWKKRQINIQYNGITYKNQFGQIKEYLPFSHGFEYFHGKSKTYAHMGVILISNHRRLVLEAQNFQDFIIFVYLLNKKTVESPYLSINKFHSFAPVRNFIESQFFIDGKQYFEALAQSLIQAKKSIYMTGWMISPQFLLRRTPEKLSLFDLIKSKVNEGVQVNILIYHQSSFLPNDSLWVKQRFQSLGHRVKVMRHPTGKLPILWSHHSKMVIIDKQIAFFGGLDLCYGRYDCNLHEIFPDNHSQLYPGIQYNNCRIKDIDNVRKFTIDHIDKRHPRLPWHDICQSVKGEIVGDFVHHFVQIWNFASYQNRQALNKDIIAIPTEHDIKTIHNIISTKQTSVQLNSVIEIQNQQKKSNRIITALSNTFQQFKNKGKQGLAILKKKILPQKRKKLEQLYRSNKKQFYLNFQNYISQVQKQLQEIKKKQQNLPNYQSQQNKQNLFYQEHPYQIKIKKQSSITSSNNHSPKKNKYLIVNPTTKNNQQNKVQIDDQYIKQLQNLQIKSDQVKIQMDQDIDSDQEVPNKIWQNKPYIKNKINGTQDCQLLRSVGNWSIGCSVEKTQFSIHIAYIQSISEAKYFIYIENQFFISSTPQTKEVKNQIANALYKRIKRAVKRNQPFKVYVMLPLLPAFAGNLESNDCTFLRMIMEWHYKTILSLMAQIKQLGVNPNDYIQFLGLRTHGVNSQGIPSTQIIYVHSKLMIVDDTTVIIGSANINDRSLLGDRDSQIAVITSGTDLEEQKRQDTLRIFSKKIKQFRIKLWKQHFQLPSQMLQDPLNENLWLKIKFLAHNNTKIYRKLFGCYPDNEMKTITDLRRLKQTSNLQDYFEQTKYICGNATQYPYLFLIDQPIQSRVISKEYFIPTQCLI